MTNEKGTFTLSPQVKTRNYMVYFGCRSTRNCLTLQNNIVKLLKFWIDNKVIFQMACILHLEYNFLHGYLKYLLPTETVDVELKIKMMQGIYTFRQDRTSHIITCNPWNTRFHLYPSPIRKMKTYLELERDLAQNQNPNPKPSQHKTTLNKLNHNLSNLAPTPRLGKPQPQRQVIKVWW